MKIYQHARDVFQQYFRPEISRLDYETVQRLFSIDDYEYFTYIVIEDTIFTTEDFQFISKDTLPEFFQKSLAYLRQE
ncbi:MAG: hypothetical protein IJQ02_11700 [Oscillospiraceae bacterium]|nr:hypothetical protein [Oscillospiraceae bacterium]